MEFNYTTIVPRAPCYLHLYLPHSSLVQSVQSVYIEGCARFREATNLYLDTAYLDIHIPYTNGRASSSGPYSGRNQAIIAIVITIVIGIGIINNSVIAATVSAAVKGTTPRTSCFEAMLFIEQRSLA